MNRAVFLDRDGVINRVILREGRPFSPCSLEELVFLPGVREALEAFRRGDFKAIVVTNQPDVSKGLLRRETVEAMHERIRYLFPVDDIKVCYHTDPDDCGCRKPKPGLILEAAREWSINLNQSFMIGDRWQDMGAGRAAGCKTILVGDGYGEAGAETADVRVGSLLEASHIILASAS